MILHKMIHIFFFTNLALHRNERKKLLPAKKFASRNFIFAIFCFFVLCGFVYSKIQSNMLVSIDSFTNVWSMFMIWLCWSIQAGNSPTAARIRDQGYSLRGIVAPSMVCSTFFALMDAHVVPTFSFSFCIILSSSFA
jgi:hypothetical protein